MPNLIMAFSKAVGVSDTLVDMIFVMQLGIDFESQINTKETAKKFNAAEKSVIRAIVRVFNQEDENKYLKCMDPQIFVISMNQMIEKDQDLVQMNINVAKSSNPIISYENGKCYNKFFTYYCKNLNNYK